MLFFNYLFSIYLFFLICQGIIWSLTLNFGFGSWQQQLLFLSPESTRMCTCQPGYCQVQQVETLDVHFEERDPCDHCMAALQRKAQRCAMKESYVRKLCWMEHSTVNCCYHIKFISLLDTAQHTYTLENGG